MISVIADRISEKMLHEGLILEEDCELYRYGFFLLISRGIFFVIACIAGALVGNLWDSIFFYILFSLLRGYAGGLHADREAVCLFITTASLFLAAKIIFCLKCGNYVMFSCCVLIVSSLLVFFIAPLDTDSKPLSKLEIRYYRRIVRLLTLLMNFGSFGLLAAGYSQFLFINCLVTGMEAALLILGKIKGTCHSET